MRQESKCPSSLLLTTSDFAPKSKAKKLNLYIRHEEATIQLLLKFCGKINMVHVKPIGQISIEKLEWLREKQNETLHI